MKAYHISRRLDLKEGTAIKLHDSLEVGTQVTDKALSELFPSGIEKNSLSIEFIKEFFPDGVSSHGINFLRVYNYSFYEQYSRENIERSNSNLSEAITEYSFELVRRLKYPHIPSRFESLFALENLDDVEKWSELTTGNYKIFEIELDPPLFKLDGSFLLSGVYFRRNMNATVDEGFFAEFNWGFSNKYWSSLNNKDMKKPELLIKLPVTLGKEIKL